MSIARKKKYVSNVQILFKIMEIFVQIQFSATDLITDYYLVHYKSL